MKSRKGFALVASLTLLAVLMALLTAYFTLSQIENASTRSTADQTAGFYAAEAGLNLRAEELRVRFLGYNRPSGTAPEGTDPCTGRDQGSGDFACKTYTVGGRRVVTYVVEHAGNPRPVRIPPGERYQNLSAQEYRYSVFSWAIGPQNRPEAILEMVFKSRLVPMFQFAAFYNKDLEILPGPLMELAGPVHSNGDLYLDAGTELRIEGQVTTAGQLFRGRKNEDRCTGRPVSVIDPANQLRPLPPCEGGRRTLIPQDALSSWNGMIQTGVDPVTVPSPEELDPRSGNIYWDEADLRLGLDLYSTPPTVGVYQANGLPDALLTGALNLCPGGIDGKAVGYTNTFPNRRESRTRGQDIRIKMLEVDMQALLNCIHLQRLLGSGKGLDDSSEGGLVFYFTVFGPNSSGINDYGVRIRNAGELAATVPNAPAIRGLTVITDQALYIKGDYNATNKKPAALIADSLNILSNAWSFDGEMNLSPRGTDKPLASDTTVYAAFLAGTDKTGNAEGAAGRDQGNYNGGLENYPRFHENWRDKTLKYRGSFVSLGEPRHVNGRWDRQVYVPPRRDWGFDTDFNDAALLPPLSPRFVYLRQERFIRQFEQ